ncbi:MAG: DUF1800 domain-containing protein [Luteimonas sp.]
MESALKQRYGYDFNAVRPPRPPIPPRTPTPNPHDIESVELYTGPTHLRDRLPTPPMFARAYARLSYGLQPSSIYEFNALGTTAAARHDALVEQQLNWETINDSAVETRLAAAGYTTLEKTLPQLWADHVASNPEYNIRMRPAWEIQRAALVRAAYSKRQLRELLVTFWHDHFNVQVSDYDAGPVYVQYDRDVIRQHAFGNFRAMLEAMAQSTSMMYYLDNRSNTRSGPNENFARELLELHTFGSGNYLGFMDPNDVPPCPEDPSFPIGYTDIDVYETASCFTGWSVNTATGGDGTFLYRATNHDSGPKFVLGRYIQPEQAALKDGRDVLDRIANHPRVAKFICKKLIRRFIGDTPSQALIDSAAVVFRQYWQSPDQIKRVLRHILLTDDARNSWNNKIRRPFEVVVAAMRALDSDFTLQVAQSKSDEFMYRLGFTGHSPYDWPAPNGFPDVATAWSGSNNYAMTWKLLNWMSESKIDNANPDTAPRFVPILETTRAGLPVAQWTATKLVDYWCNRILGYLPESQRRQALIDFMRQNGDAATYVIADTDTWSATDLKKHYNQQRLRSMVSLILMSPEFFAR